MRIVRSCRRAAAVVSWSRARRRNPLRRGTDRVESWLLALTVALAVALPVPVGIAVGGAYEHVQRAAIQHALVTDATIVRVLTPGGPSRAAQPHPTEALARWRTPAGQERTGEIRVSARAVAGATVPVGLDRAGNAVAPPRTPQQIHTNALVFGFSAGWGVLLALWAAFALAKFRLARARLAAWEHEWAQVEPGWSRSSH